MTTEQLSTPPSPWDRLDQITKRAVEHPVEEKIGYPFPTKEHYILHTIARMAREKVDKNVPELDRYRDKEVAKTARFFGLDPENGEIFIWPSAMDAFDWCARRFIPPNTSVIIPTPVYPTFPKKIHYAGDGSRTTVPIDCTDGLDIERIEQAIKFPEDNDPVSTIFLVNPRNPDMHCYDQNKLKKLCQLANNHDITIISDEVFILFDPETKIKHTITESILERERNAPTATVRPKGISQFTPDYKENHVVTDIPRGKLQITIRGTSKILPQDLFPKLAVVQISPDVLSKTNPEIIAVDRTNYFRTPSTADIFIINQVLHSELFLELPNKIQEVSKHNYAYLESQLSGTEMRYCGSFALVDIKPYLHFEVDSIFSDMVDGLSGASISIQMVKDFYPPHHFPQSTEIRLPIISDPEQFAKRVARLKTNLVLLKERQKTIGELWKLHLGS